MAASERSAGPVTRRWGRIFAALIVAFAVVEVAARAFFLAWAGRPFDSLSPYIWSPYGLVRNNPALTSPQFQINPNGFRNLESFERLKPERTFRVMLLGGSVLYAGLAQVFLQEEGRVDSSGTIAQHLRDIMSGDPDLKGVRIEVINAAVNFNRIVEVSGAYLAEYAFWDPDLVIVFGSANNFLTIPTREEIRKRTHNIQGDHPWRLEFERVVNRRDLSALAENALRVAADNFASIALLKKVIVKSTDAALAAVQAAAIAAPRAPPSEFADPAGEETYFRHYAAFADALIAAARRHDHGIAFFWEYFLGDLGAVKDLSPQEERLYRGLNRIPAQIAYSFRMRDRWIEHLRQASVTYVDPLDRLRAERETVFIDYLHYTRRGNRLAAEATYEAVKPMVTQRLAAARPPDAAQ